MSATDRSPRRCSELQRYEIRVQGHLDARWADWVDGLAFTHEGDGTTTLTGPLVDQAALHGVLTRIRDLGLPLVSLRRVCPDRDASDASDASQDTEDSEEGRTSMNATNPRSTTS
jgi:hypothetical protein